MPPKVVRRDEDGAEERRGGGREAKAVQQGRRGHPRKDGEVGNALSKQFNVGIMPVTTHAISDYCGEQTLNGSEHRHCNGRRKQRHD